jgi:5-hydroxyisourate hydrolase-like protein (transthyretin family)
MRRGAGLALVCLALQLFEPAARAAPIVSIQARTDIELDPIRRSQGRITINGRLVDRAGRQGVPAAGLTVRLDTGTRTIYTNAEGEFTVTFPITEGKHNLRIDYPGNRSYTPASHEITDFDIDRDPLTVDVEAPATVKYGGGGVELTIKTGVDGAGVPLAVEVRFGHGDGNKLPTIGTVTTNANGRGTFRIPRNKLGGPGTKRVMVVFAGDDSYDAATAQTTFSVITETTLTFALAHKEVAHESRVRGDGRLLDANGTPIPRGPVALLVGDRRMAEVLTNKDGRFEFNVSAAEVGKGKFNVQAVFEPTKSWRRGSRSEPTLLLISEPRPVPIRYTIAAFGLTALAMIAFFALRSRPWERWLARLRRQDADEKKSDDEPTERDAAPVHTGLQHARPGLVSTLRRASDNGFTGLVRDAIRHRPLRDATVTVEHDTHGERTTTSDAHGGFEISELEPGTWTAHVTRFGYCEERFRVSIPHRGELRGARVDLLPVREKIFAMYREVAEPLLPQPKLWGVWTPRQVFDHVRNSRPAPALSELTDFVEETYFSQRTPDERALLDAAALIDAARDERAL